jgi:hypothetical protein
VEAYGELLGGEAAPTHHHPKHNRAARDTPTRQVPELQEPAGLLGVRTISSHQSLSLQIAPHRPAGFGRRTARSPRRAGAPPAPRSPPPGPAGGPPPPCRWGLTWRGVAPLTGAPRPAAHERRPRDWRRVRGLWRELLVRPADGKEAPLVRTQPARAGSAAPCGCDSTWCWMAALSLMEGWRKI